MKKLLTALVLLLVTAVWAGDFEGGVEEKLRTLEELSESGLITELEYKDLRAKVLEEFLKNPAKGASSPLAATKRPDNLGKSESNEVSRRDLRTVTDLINGFRGCDFQSQMKLLDIDLMIRLWGRDLVKLVLTPKINSPRQNTFYRLVSQSNSMPNSSDKSSLLNMLGREACIRPYLDFDSKVLRESQVAQVRVRAALTDEISRDLLTYEQIFRRMVQQEQEGPDELGNELQSALTKHPDLAAELKQGVEFLLSSFDKALFEKYQINLISVKM